MRWGPTAAAALFCVLCSLLHPNVVALDNGLVLVSLEVTGSRGVAISFQDCECIAVMRLTCLDSNQTIIEEMTTRETQDNATMTASPHNRTLVLSSLTLSGATYMLTMHDRHGNLIANNTVATEPDPVTDLHITEVTHSSLTAHWTPPQTTVYSAFVVCCNQNCTLLDKDELDFTFDDLSASSSAHNISITVMSHRKSTSVHLYSISTAPSAPENLSIVKLTPHTVLVQWNSVSESCDLIDVNVRDAMNGNIVSNESLECNITQLTILDLQDNTAYFVQASVIYANISSAATQLRIQTLSSDITELNVALTSAGVVRLTWAPSPRTNVYLGRLLTNKNASCILGLILTKETNKSTPAVNNTIVGNALNDCESIISVPVIELESLSTAEFVKRDEDCLSVHWMTLIAYNDELIPYTRDSQAILQESDLDFNISASVTNRTTLQLSWSPTQACSDATTYTVTLEYRDCNDTLIQTHQQSQSTELDIRGLEPSTRYEASVTVNRVSTKVGFKTSTRSPDTPTNLTVASLTDTSITLTWRYHNISGSSSSGGGLDSGILGNCSAGLGFRVQLRHIGDTYPDVVQELNTTRVKVTFYDLQYATRYQARIQAYSTRTDDLDIDSDDLVGQWTTWVDHSTPESVPDPVTDVMYEVDALGNAYFNWSTPAVTRSYSVRYQVEVHRDKVIVFTENVSAPNITVTDLYFYKLYSINIIVTNERNVSENTQLYFTSGIAVPLPLVGVTVTGGRRTLTVNFDPLLECHGATRVSVTVAHESLESAFAHDSAGSGSIVKILDGVCSLSTSASIQVPVELDFWMFHILINVSTRAGSRVSHHLARTLPGVPGLVRDVSIGSLCNEGKATLITNFERLTLYERRSNVTGYEIEIYIKFNQVYQNKTITIQEDKTKLNQEITFTTIAHSLHTISITALSVTGRGLTTEPMRIWIKSCVPWIDTFKGNYYPKPVRVAKLYDANRQVELNTSLIIDLSHTGRETERGIIVSTFTDIKAESYDSKDFYNIFSYGWCRNCMSNVNRSFRYIMTKKVETYTIGEQRNCHLSYTDNCNGYLAPGVAYIFQFYICTKAGCQTSHPSDLYVTAPVTSQVTRNVLLSVLIPLAAILSAILFVIIMLIIRKKHASNVTRTKQTTNKTNDLDFTKFSSASGSDQIQLGHYNPSFTSEQTLTPNDIRPSKIHKKRITQRMIRMHNNSNLLFTEEYKLLQTCSPKSPSTVSELIENKRKNRYLDILPYDHSRVKLEIINDDIYSDYINANYMPGYNSKKEFIACQGPLESTQSDFWRMVWEQKSHYIVMLTKLKERGKIKCSKYWPDLNNTQTYGNIEVKMIIETDNETYRFREFELKKGSKIRTVIQMHYRNWPDFGCPGDCKTIISFAKEFRNRVDFKVDGPVVVQCSAGVGRTGTFICIDHMLQHIEDYDGIDIFGMAIEMRQYRVNMVQTEDQYIYIHECLQTALIMQENNEQAELPSNVYGNYGNYDRDDTSSQGSVRSKAGSLDGSRPITKPSQSVNTLPPSRMGSYKLYAGKSGEVSSTSNIAKSKRVPSTYSTN